MTAIKIDPTGRPPRWLRRAFRQARRHALIVGPDDTIMLVFPDGYTNDLPDMAQALADAGIMNCVLVCGATVSVVTGTQP